MVRWGWNTELSLHRVPAHQPRCGPVGYDGFDQPSAGTSGLECDALGLAGFDRERVEPIGLPAVVELVEQAEMVAVEMEDGGDGCGVLERQHDGAAGLGAKGGGGGRREICGPYPPGVGCPERDIESQGASQIEPVGQVIRREWQERRQRRTPLKLAGDHQAADLARLLAV